MGKSLKDAFEQLLARCDDPVRRAELERSIAYALATHDRFTQQLKACRENPIEGSYGVLAGPLKGQTFKPLKFNKSKARKIALVKKNEG